jgi:Uma2 family endonuclease
MRPNPIQKLSPEEFLEFERSSGEKHEYLDGVVVAMSGAKRNHNKIVTNLSGLIWQHLRGKDCESYTNDMRVFVPKTGAFTYPDLVVVCGEPEFKDTVPDTLTNPLLLVEVLSDSTEGYDRGTKFQHYRSIQSLREYVLVAQTEARIEKYVKQGDGFWILSEAVGPDAQITFETIDCTIPLAEVYDKIHFGSDRDVSNGRAQLNNQS